MRRLSVLLFLCVIITLVRGDFSSLEQGEEVRDFSVNGDDLSSASSASSSSEVGQEENLGEQDEDLHLLVHGMSEAEKGVAKEDDFSSTTSFLSAPTTVLEDDDEEEEGGGEQKEGGGEEEEEGGQQEEGEQEEQEEQEENDGEDDLFSSSSSSSERADDETDTPIPTEEDDEESSLQAAEQALLVETCRESFACQQQRDERLHQQQQHAESARKQCEEENARRFAEAKAAYANCTSEAAAQCVAIKGACDKRQQLVAKEAQDSGIHVSPASCDTACPPTRCMFSFEQTSCVEAVAPNSTTATTVTSPSVPANTTSGDACASSECEQLCPAQGECEESNHRLMLAYRADLERRQVELRRCERENADAYILVSSFVKKCEAENAALLARCAANVPAAVNGTNSSSSTTGADGASSNSSSSSSSSSTGLPCPTTACILPEVKIASCEFPIPPLPKLSSCVEQCSNAECEARAKCEREDSVLLRQVSHYERVVHRCEMEKSKTLVSAHYRILNCQQRQVMQRVACQIQQARTVLRAHRLAKTCMSSTPISEWGTKCTANNAAIIANSTASLPVCTTVISCVNNSTTPAAVNATVTPAPAEWLQEEGEDAYEEDLQVDEDPLVPSTGAAAAATADSGSPATDCRARYASLKPDPRRVLHHCGEMCKNTMYAKWRGEDSVDKEVQEFKSSSIFQDYLLYREHASKCINDECRQIARREWRRALISCSPLDDESRERRKFKGSVIRHQVETILAFEHKKKLCGEGEAGKTCRRVLAAHTRRLLHSCPPNQSGELCDDYLRDREVRILKECGPAGSSAECRRVRRHCVRRFSRLRSGCAEDDQECLKASWEMVEKKCFLVL